jgi:hypothetical protein
MADERNIPMDGGCTCRSVRYRLKARPMFVHCCHCTWCQRESGSAFAVNALIEASNVELLQGEPIRTKLPSASGRGQVFSRCPQCGITLWSNYAGAGERVHFIRAGTLDDPSRAPPDLHIYTSTKQPWVVLPEAVPAVPEFYRLSSYWPAASIERFNAARASGSA